VDAAIARIHDLNPTLNAVIHDRFEKARAEAASPALCDSPFRGVPFLVKDLIAHSAGDPFHEGIRRLAQLGFREDSDTELIRRFRAAGLIDVGRTNTSELGLLPTTEPDSYGPTRNPWSLDRTPLGSGGGSAAAVAAGLVPLAHSNDAGGSIRLPASACGLVGLKPSRGRVTLAPEFGDLGSGAITEFVITRSVRDTAAVLEAVTAAPMCGEPYAAPSHSGPYLDTGRPVDALHIGLMDTAPGQRTEVHPDCAFAAHLAGRLLESLGQRVEQARPTAIDDGGFAVHAPRIIPFAFCAFTLDWWERRTGIRLGPADLECWTWTCAERGRALNAGQYLSAVEWIQAWSRRMAAWWAEGFDILLTPTVAEPPPQLGTFAAQPDKPMAPGIRSAQISAFTFPFNMTGQPAISLPLHWNGEGLPIGVQLIAAPGRDDLVIQLASQLETACPWQHRTPFSQNALESPIRP
jgi:amidase